ncbi:MAG: hypothetical protein ACT4OY_08440 [Alphaproteobacteria bacterium]
MPYLALEEKQKFAVDLYPYNTRDRARWGIWDPSNFTVVAEVSASDYATHDNFRKACTRFEKEGFVPQRFYIKPQNLKYLSSEEESKNKRHVILPFESLTNIESLPGSRKPFVLGSVRGLTQSIKNKGSHYFHRFDTLKKPDSTDIGLKGWWSFLTPVVKAVAEDFLRVNGESAFERSQLVLLAERDYIKPAQKARPKFGGWHNHYSENISYIYGLADRLPTEFKDREESVAIAPVNGLVRFSGEFTEHRSPQNDTLYPVRRTWLSFIFYKSAFKVTRQNQNAIPGLLSVLYNDDKRDEYIRNGATYLARGRHLIFSPGEQPQPLF